MATNRLFWAIVVLVGAGAGIGLLVLRPASSAAPTVEAPAASWAAGTQRAPAFRLRDQNGQPVSLASFRGGPVLVTFIDPLCRDYCPLEATRLMDVVRSTHTPVIAVSANPFGNARANLVQDNRKWHLTRDWHWAVGSWAQLRAVWNAYHVAFLVTTKKIAGVKVRYIVHTEGSYLIDANGDERALFLWPYYTNSVVQALHRLS